ncbi:uncharacterized protein TNCV_3592721 [Trichonephila clavipes]|nr:uncharacterized protein TNCV_3592721 [Trichonephila clavipes]
MNGSIVYPARSPDSTPLEFYLWCFLKNAVYSKSCGRRTVKVSDHDRHVMSSSPVPLKTRRVGLRCTLNLLRAETSSRWCSVVVRGGGCQLRCRPYHT